MEEERDGRGGEGKGGEGRGKGREGKGACAVLTFPLKKTLESCQDSRSIGLYYTGLRP